MGDKLDPDIKSKIKDIINLITSKSDKEKKLIKTFIEKELVKVILKESGTQINASKHIETALRYSIHEIIDVITNAIISGEVNSKRLAVKALLKISAVLAKAICEVGGKCVSKMTTPVNNGKNAIGVIPETMSTNNNFSRSSATRSSSRRQRGGTRKKV
jgi:hypothetical protein